jgi:hypothetical protein
MHVELSLESSPSLGRAGISLNLAALRDKIHLLFFCSYISIFFLFVVNALIPAYDYD